MSDKLSRDLLMDPHRRLGDDALRMAAEYTEKMTLLRRKLINTSLPEGSVVDVTSRGVTVKDPSGTTKVLPITAKRADVLLQAAATTRK